jgi:hypothetical protein
MTLLLDLALLELCARLLLDFTEDDEATTLLLDTLVSLELDCGVTLPGSGKVAPA